MEKNKTKHLYDLVELEVNLWLNLCSDYVPGDYLTPVAASRLQRRRTLRSQYLGSLTVDTIQTMRRVGTELQ